MNPVDQLRDGKCKLCWGLWLHPKKVEDNGAHKYGECRGARCGRCGELADHYEKNCAETGLPLAQMWPAFPGMAAKQVLENNFAGERADNKGKEFSWWKSAVKRCTSDKKGEEGAKYLVDQAREREERENVATAKEDAKSQAVAAKVSKAKAKEANPTPFTLPYPITTLRDIPKTSMEAYRTVTYNLDTGNPDKTVTSRNEFRNSFQNGAKAQTIKDLIDGYLTEADKQKITKNVFENVFEPRQNIASRYDGALKSDWEESEPRVFSNHFPLHIGDGVKLFYYTVTLKATKAEKAKKEMKAKEEEKDEHTDEGNADLPNPGNPKPKLGEPHPDLSDFNGQLQSGFLPKINQNSVVKKNQTYSSSPASDGHGRGLGPPAGMLPYRPAPKHPSMSDGKIAGTIYGSSPAVPSKAKGKQPAPSNKTSAGEQSRSEDETLILDNLNLDANLENATSESVGAGTDESTPRSSRAIKRMVISQLLRQCNELQQNANHLATDFIQTIVSWKDLFPDAQSDEVYQGTVHLRPESAKNKKTFQVTIKRQDTIALDTFKQHVEGVVTQAAITCNTSKIAELLSIFVSRHVSQNAGYSEYETPINESRQSTTKGAGKLKSDVPVERSEYTFKQIGTKYFATEQFKTLDCDERDNVTPLGTAFCAMRGFNTNIVSGMGQAFLNVNVCASAFFKCLTVAQFFDLFAAESTLELGKRLLSRVRVYIVEDRKGTFLNDASARIKTIQSFEREENIPTFKDKKTKMDTTVKDYLLNTHGWAKVSDLPYVNVGGYQEGKQSWFPPEKLRILPYQPFRGQLPTDLISRMIDFSRRTASENKYLVTTFGESALRLMRPARDQFGTWESGPKVPLIPNVEIEPLLAKHASARIPPPIVKYADQNSAKIDDFGKWNLNKSQFHSTASQVKIRIHAIVSESFKPRNYRGAWNGKADRSLLYHFVELFKSLQACGLPTDGVWDYTLFNEDSADATWQHQINTGFGQASSNGANLVILMLKKKKMTSDCYAFFKRMADMEHGVASGCITRRKEDKYIQNYMGNVTMKINLKFPAQETGEPSRNHIVPQILEQLEDTLVIGADVTHPGPGSIAGTPSIAAVIGSADAYGCHYTGSLKLQAHSDEKQSTEIIPCSGMKTMVQQCIVSHVERHGKMPGKILFYRDGVSQGQYLAFKEQEVKAIREAFGQVKDDLVSKSRPKYLARLEHVQNDKDAEVKITAVVGEKRHHTRFYPKTGNEAVGKGENCRFGTMVDAGPTSPYHYDFYLQAHHGLEGTVKPTHYFVVLDEIGHSPRVLQELTNNLSFVYQRATMPVSYVAPTYYADHLAERGRKYLKPFLDGNDKNLETISRLYIDYVGTNDKCANARSRGFRQPSELAAALKSVKADKHAEASRVIWDAANVAFKADPFKGQSTSHRGPWQKALDNTMFWL